MRLGNLGNLLSLVIVAYLASGTGMATADDYWHVRCKNQGYGIDFNVRARKAFIILTTDQGGTIPAASTSNIVRYVNRPNDKYAVFDFGSATKIGVNVSRADDVFIYRLLQSKTYRVCDATVEIKTSGAPQPNDQIAFTSRPNGGTSQVFIINPNGDKRRQVTTSSGDKYGPSLSSDGRKVAFHTRRGGNNDVYTVDIASGNEKKITSHSGSDLFPAFSPDGRKIAFISDRHGRKNLYVKSANGTGSATRLTDTSQAIDGQPSWSPDGREIAFAEGWGETWDVKVIAAGGGASRRVTSGAEPDWSPDGSKLVYRSSDGTIYTINRNGSGRHQMVSGSGEFNSHPSWASDGRQIVFDTSRHSRWGDKELYVVDVGDGRQTRITNNDLDDSAPDWGGK